MKTQKQAYTKKSVGTNKQNKQFKKNNYENF